MLPRVISLPAAAPEARGATSVPTDAGIGVSPLGWARADCEYKPTYDGNVARQQRAVCGPLSLRDGARRSSTAGQTTLSKGTAAFVGSICWNERAANAGENPTGRDSFSGSFVISLKLPRNNRMPSSSCQEDSRAFQSQIGRQYPFRPDHNPARERLICVQNRLIAVGGAMSHGRGWRCHCDRPFAAGRWELMMKREVGPLRQGRENQRGFIENGSDPRR